MKLEQNAVIYLLVVLTASY